ncbi:rod shape-determining protein MreD [Streptococcus dentiloxodontae]
MEILKKPVMLYFLTFVALLWDGHLSEIADTFLPNNFFVVSHLLLIFVFYLAAYFQKATIAWYLAFLGFLYDAYYFKAMGIVVFILPLLYLFVLFVLSKLRQSLFVDFLVIFLMVSLFEVAAYGLGLLYKITSYNYLDVIVYQLAPTMVFNVLLFILIKKPIEKLFSYYFDDIIK